MIGNLADLRSRLREIDGFRPYEAPEGGERVYWRVPVRVALSNSFGFGGTNVTLAFRRVDPQGATD